MTQQTPDPEEAQAAIEYCYAQGWSDGLPLVPASQPLIDKFLATTSKDPDEVIGELEQVGRNCTVYLAAVNAAMAGCLPEYFPVVLAAFDALMRERAARGGGWQSTSGPAPMIVVNGPVRHELGFNAAGRRVRPRLPAERHHPPRHRPDRPQRLRRPPARARAGHPGPAGPVVDLPGGERGGVPVAAVRRSTADSPPGSARCRRRCCARASSWTTGTPRTPSRSCDDIADTISRTGSLIFRDTSAGVVFCPEHAQMLATAGFTKQDVQAWLIEHCGRTGADLRRAGKNGLRGIARFADADTSADDTFTRILPSPRHVPIVVAGARNAAISMVVRIFGEWSGTATEVTK